MTLQSEITELAQAVGADVKSINASLAGKAPSSHVGSGGNSHAAATTGTAGFMSAADKAKLDGMSSSSIANFSYENRGNLRTTTGDYAIVDLLGLFEFEAGSTEPDDDESAFATATGRWLLKCPAFDLLEAWNLPRYNVADKAVLDMQAIATNWPGRKIDGYVPCALTSIAASTAVSFSGTVTGARPTDTIIATAPGYLGDTLATSGRLSYYAYCGNNDVVTIIIANSSATATTTNIFIRTNWIVSILRTS